MLKLPALLECLLAEGRWPRTPEEALRQNLSPLVSTSRIQQFAPEESRIYLFAPPFHTVAEQATTNPHWCEPQSAPHEIDFTLALDIGDFGLGSDAPILLDYRASRSVPRVIRLRWPERGGDNHWVEVAPDFKAFVHLLGFTVPA